MSVSGLPSWLLPAWEGAWCNRECEWVVVLAAASGRYHRECEWAALLAAAPRKKELGATVSVRGLSSLLLPP